jgi:Zn-dependent peptidase ImmA (M78 family)
MNSDHEHAPEFSHGLRGAEECRGEEPAEDFELLQDHWDERATHLLETFVSPRILHEKEQRTLQRFAHLCLRYAHLEHRIEGEIPCEIPAHISVFRDDRLEGLRAEAEALADAERDRLGVREGPIEDLPELLDDRGIKIIEWRHSGSERSGAFLFDVDTGPALLALAPTGSPTGRFILAHEYCHLLADVDPYRNRFCPHGCTGNRGALDWGGRLLEDVESEDAFDELALPETRADLFARAFLLPREHFPRTLGVFGQQRDRSFDLPKLSEVAFYYGVDTPVVLSRLIDLDLLPVSEAVAMATDLDEIETMPPARDSKDIPPPRGPEHSPNALEGLPTRFVNLSLALFLKRIASHAQLGTLLDVDMATVERLLRWLDLPEDIRGQTP